jgi:hypothetical protein
MGSSREKYATRDLTTKQLSELAEIRTELGGVHEASRQDVRSAWIRLRPTAKYAPAWLVENPYFLKPDETGSSSTVLLDPSSIPVTPFPPKRRHPNTSI